MSAHNVKFLKDEPIEIVKSPLVEALINELYESSGKIIGLLGSWGSGKSSIIESLKKSKKLNVLEYDAWKNEGYPFKLGFLKFLLSEENTKGISTDTINEKTTRLKVLQQVKDTQTSVNYSIINLPNTLIATSLLFYPLAFSMIENNRTSLYSPSWAIGHFNIIAFISILSIGIISLLLNSAIESKKTNTILSHFWNKNIFCTFIIAGIVSFLFEGVTAVFIFFMPLIFWSIFNLGQLFDKITGKTKEFYIFSGTTPHTESIITINKTPEPDFGDFKNLYSEILSCILENNKKSKTVIVVDNIDRIEVEEAKNIWSCLKGMILKDTSINIIIPIDEKQISEIYKENQTDDNKTASFVQKTFDMTFRISPFIMTKAKEFWNKKLDEAFENISEIEKDEIICIFDTRNDETENKVLSHYAGNLTPRKIIKLINEVVSLEKIPTFSSISIVTKFAYCLHYTNISNQLQNHKLINLFPQTNNILNKIAKEKQADIAALYYSVSPKEAISIVKEESICKDIMEENYNLSVEDASSSWIWDILFNGLTKKSNEPFSVLINILANLLELNKINPCKNNYLFEKIINKIEVIESIDKISDKDSNILSNSIFNNYASAIENIIKIILNDNEKISPNDYKNATNLIVDLIKKYNITKTDLHNFIENHISKDFYLEMIPLLKKEDYKLFDSYILEPKNLEDIIENIDNNEDLYKHLEFVIDCPPNNEHKESWNEKLNNIIIPAIHENISKQNMSKLLLKVLSTNVSDIKTENISSNSFLSTIQNIENQSDLGTLFGIYFKYNDNVNFTNWNYYSNYQKALNKIKNIDVEYISNFAKAYIQLSDNNILSILELQPDLPNKKEFLDYAVEHKDLFNINSLDYFTKYDKYILDYPKIKELLQKVKASNNIESAIRAIEFNNANKNLLYLLSQETNQENLKAQAYQYFDAIDKNTWTNYLQNYDLNFKNALILQYKGNEYIEALKESLMNLFQNDKNTFIESLRNEIPYLRQLDKSIKFINDYLDNNLSLDNYDLLIENFEDSVNKWLKKTSHKHDSETIFTNFIRKIDDKDWLIKNKTTVKKYIITDDNKNTFLIKWQNEEEILNAYKNTIAISK